MDFVRTDNILGNKKVIIGDKYTDLVLETLGKVYIKTGNKSQVLDQLINTLIQNADTPKTVLVNSEQEMNDMDYPGDGAFIYNKLNNSLYIALDNRYILILQVQTGTQSGYVRKSGDTMSGSLEIVTTEAPLIIHSSKLVNNLNAQYLNNYSSDDFTKKKKDEIIYGNWSFDGQCTSNNNWIFKENTRFYKDIVTSGNLSSPQFASGFGGYGWRLDSNTNTLTIDNLVVRKVMQVYEMVINQISATNGSLWVSNSTKVEKVYRPYLITKEELDAINTGTKEQINAKLNKILWNNSYFLITDQNLSINQDTNNLGVSDEQNIGTVTESKGLSSSNTINTTPKEFINFKYIIWIGDLNKVLEDENFPGVSAFYDENYLFNVNTNSNIKAYYLSKEVQVTEWNEDNTPKVSHYLSTFNKGTEIFVKPRDSEEIIGLKPYYKYFALPKDSINLALSQHVNNGIKQVPVPTIYIIDADSSMDPTLKSGDIVRCQKFEENNIKYYDAIVTSHFKSKSYILQKVASVFDTYTEVSYNDTGEVQSITETDNSILYNKTNQSYNPETGEYENNYPTAEKIADVAADDDIVQIGNIYNTQRQNAIYITSTDDQSPYIDIMSGLNRPDYSVLYDQPAYKKIKVFIKQKGNIFVQGEAYDYYYQKENPIAINFNQKPSYISGNTKEFPLVYVEVNSDLEVTNIYINDGEVNNIPSDTSEGYFITNYQTQYSIKDSGIRRNKITKVRLGNLDGIYNEIFGNKQPYGYGLYGENVFLTGEFYLNNGKSVVDFSKEQIILEISGLISKNVLLQSKGPFSKSIQLILKKPIVAQSVINCHWNLLSGQNPNIYLNVLNSPDTRQQIYSGVNTTNGTFDGLLIEFVNPGEISEVMISLGSDQYPWEPAEVDSIGSSFIMTENGISLLGNEINLTGQIKFSYLDSSTQDTLSYLRENLRDATKESTQILGGLILTNTVVLGESKDNVFTVYSGISGNYDTSQLGNGISYWAGGDPFDKQSVTGDNYPDGIVPASALIRMDGTGYLANGNLWWEANGNLHADPLSFFVGEEAVGDVLSLFQFIKEDGVTKYVIPQHPFSDLIINTSLKIGDVYIKWDSNTNSLYASKEDGTNVNFYVTGGISAKGLSQGGGSSGGGLDEELLWAILGNNGTEQISKTHLTTALSEYITTTSADDKYATKVELSNYATIESLNQTNANVTVITDKLNDFLEGSDTDTIINKWKELEAFLNGMSESDNLAEILATKADITWTQEQLDLKLDKSTFNDLFEKVQLSDGNYAIRAKYGFYSDNFVSSKGLSYDIGAGLTGDITINIGDESYKSENGVVTLPPYPEVTELSWNNIIGKPSWIGDTKPSYSFGELTGKPTTIEGYGITDTYTKAESDSRYVNVAGDTMTGALIFNSAQDQLIVLNSERTPYIEFQLNGVRQAVFGGVDNVPAVYTNTWHEIWHAGNDGSGSGLDADLLDGYHRNNLFSSFLNQIESLDFTSDFIVNGDANTYYPVRIDIFDRSLKHLIQQVSVWRNLGEQCADYSGNHVNGTSSLWLCYEYRSTVWDGNCGFIRTTLMSQPYANLCANTTVNAQILGCIVLWLRGGGTIYHVSSTGGKPSCYIYYERTNIQNGTYPDYVEPRTTIGNNGVINWGNHYSFINTYGGSAWATKLETPRTIWGQSFDGTGNISGQLSGCTRITNSTSQPLYLGNADNSSWVYTQDISSQQGESYWAINQAGNSWFKKVNIGYTYPNEGSFPLNVQGTVSSTSLSTQNIRIECDNSGALSGRGNEINNYNSHLYLQHNTTTNLICCMGGGNMGIGTNPSYKLHVAGYIKSTSIFTDSWFRSNGNTGWYSETYGGGIYMQDDTWIRTYNNKQFYCNKVIAGNPFAVFDIGGYSWNYGAAAYNVQIYNNDNQTPLILGFRNDISDTGSNRVFAMELLNSGTEVRFNLSSSTKLTVHSSGITVTGNIVATGAITAKSVSDIRLKTIIPTKVDYQQKLLDLGDVVDFYYNDTAINRNTGAVDRERHIGLIYQNAVKLNLVNFCHTDDDGFGNINYIAPDYINLIAGACQLNILGLRALAKRTESIEQRVARLEKENIELKQKLDAYEKSNPMVS